MPDIRLLLSVLITFACAPARTLEVKQGREAIVKDAAIVVDEENVLGYCLMTNHVHIIAAPSQDDSLARAIGRTHFRYTQYINRMGRRSGHLWQNRFFSLRSSGNGCRGLTVTAR